MRYAAKRDANEPAIARALRKAGCSVVIVDQPCDLIVGRAGLTYLLEIKDGSKVKSARKLTKSQQAWRKTWRGQVATVESESEALAAVGLEAFSEHSDFGGGP